MPDVFRSLDERYGDPGLLVALAVVSAVMFIASVLAVPYFLARLPADYYSGREKRARALVTTKRPLRMLGVILKNVLGALLVLFGVAMLLLPGQGVLTLLAGLLLLDFPGKYRFERALIGSPRVLRVVNALRRRWNRPPLEL